MFVTTRTLSVASRDHRRRRKDGIAPIAVVENAGYGLCILSRSERRDGHVICAQPPRTRCRKWTVRMRSGMHQYASVVLMAPVIGR